MLRYVFYISIIIAGLVSGASAQDFRPKLNLPVDIANSSGATVNTAHSTWRALSAGYNGPLFILTRTSDSSSTIIKTVGPGAGADLKAIATFCGALNANGCSYSVLCDQVVTTCSASNYSAVTISNASPAVVTWSGSSFSAGQKIYFDCFNCKSITNNMPQGANSAVTVTSATPAVVTWTSHGMLDGTPFYFNGSPAPTGTSQWKRYYVLNHTANTFQFSKTLGGAAVATSSTGTSVTAFEGLIPQTVYYVVNPGVGGAGTFNIAATLGGAPLNTTSAGTGPFYAFLPGNNDLYTLDSNTTPSLAFSSLPTGEKIPVLTLKGNQFARNRAGTVGLPTGSAPISIYGLFAMNQWGQCCGSYGDIEDTVFNNAQGTMFAMAPSAAPGTGIVCENLPCMIYDGENGVFSNTVYSTVTISNASPGVVTWTGHKLSAGTPLFLTTTGTLPTGLSTDITYYVINPTTNTFQLAATIGGTAINTSSAGSGIHTASPNPQPAATSGFITGMMTCDGGTAGTTPDAVYTLDVGYETTPFFTNYGERLPTGWNCAVKAGGMSIGEGGDGSGSTVTFMEGLVTTGRIEAQYRAQMQAAIYNRMNVVTPPAGLAYNFISGSVPTGWTFTRGACTQTGGTPPNPCTTDAEYTDAPGVAYNTFTTNTPRISAKGFGSFTKRQNWIVNSDCDAGTCPVTQTTPSLIVGSSYILFCNSSTGTITSSAATAVGSGFGTLACNSGQYQTINITTAGTITLTFAGSWGTHNWADLQDNAQLSSAVVTISNATPAVVTKTAHGLVAGNLVSFTTTGALPTGLSVNTVYCVLAAGLAANTFEVGATCGGAAINTSSAGSGTHTAWEFIGAGASGPTPHIITNTGIVPVKTSDDSMAIGSTVGTWLESDTASAIVEAKVMTNTPFNGLANSGYFLGASGTHAYGMWYSTTSTKAGDNSTGDGTFDNTNLPTIGTAQRFGATLAIGTYTESINGVFDKTDNAGPGAQTSLTAGATHYLGYDSLEHIACNCWITRAAFYPYVLTQNALTAKSTLGAPLP